jgi:hypothetical protein
MAPSNEIYERQPREGLHGELLFQYEGQAKCR